MPSVHSMRPPDSSPTRLRIAYPYSSPSERIPSTSGVAEAATRSLSMRTCPPYIELLGIIPRSSRYLSGDPLNCAEPFDGEGDGRISYRSCLRLRERPVGSPELQRERQRLLAGADRVRHVHVEEPYVLEQVAGTLAQRCLDVARLYGRVDDQRNVLLRHRPRRQERHRTGARHEVVQQVERELSGGAARRQPVRLSLI